MFIYNKMPHSISAESYKSIRTSLKYSSVDNTIKTIVITSSVPGEGKSTIAGNLALCLSESGNKVLIIDCDLRKPSLHKKFRLSNSKGITDCLIDKDNLKESIQEFTSELSVILSGTIPPNPAEILGSKTFERFLKNIGSIYDYIILDTPPLLAVTDASILAGKADATIIVVKYGKTREKDINLAYKELKKVNANVVGSILNSCDMKRTDSYYKYYPKEKKSFFSKKSRKRNYKKYKTKKVNA
ncbi:CpsD/CapB family tyrosine-protein kinase [Clostridium sp. UBA7503]|uniref:CpsD/CapB family tyrosine-protein kinase n=1 Tax=Clostridium sp. UBA7503 TaxID=1946377 RepID=UPI0032161F66